MVDSSATEVAANSAPVQAPTQPVSQKIKAKIDGVEEEVDLEDLKRDYQKYRSSEKRFQEASEMRKQVEGLLDRAQKGDLSWLTGIVPEQQLRKWQEEQLLEHIKWSQLPENEQQRILLQRENEELKRERDKSKQEREREQYTALEERAFQEIETDIVTAINELGYDKNVTPRLVRRISEQMLASLESSDDDTQVQPIPAKIASQRAWKGLHIDAQELMSILPQEEAMKLIPPKLREAIRRADVSDAQSQMPSRIKQQTSSAEKRTTRRPKKMSTDDWFSKMEKRFN